MRQVWGYDTAAGQRTVDVHVAQVRAKLGEPRRHPHGPRRRVCGRSSRTARPVGRAGEEAAATDPGHPDRAAGGVRRGPHLGGRHRHQRQPAPAGRASRRRGRPSSRWPTRPRRRPRSGVSAGGGPGPGPQGAAVDQRPDRRRAHPRERRAHPRRRPGRRAVADPRPDAAPRRRASRCRCGSPATTGSSSSRPGRRRPAGSSSRSAAATRWRWAARRCRQLTISLVITGLIAVALGLLVAWRLSRPLKRTAAAATAMAPGVPRRRDPRGGSARGGRGGRVGEPAGRRAVPLRGPPARVPPLGVPRPAYAAHRDHRLRRVAGRRGGAAGPPGRGRDGHRRRGETPGTARRRPARPGPAGRHGDADGLRAGGPAPASSNGAAEIVARTAVRRRVSTSASRRRSPPSRSSATRNGCGRRSTACWRTRCG